MLQFLSAHKLCKYLEAKIKAEATDLCPPGVLLRQFLRTSFLRSGLNKCRIRIALSLKYLLPVKTDLVMFVWISTDVHEDRLVLESAVRADWQSRELSTSRYQHVSVLGDSDHTRNDDVDSRRRRTATRTS